MEQTKVDNIWAKEASNAGEDEGTVVNELASWKGVVRELHVELGLFKPICNLLWTRYMMLARILVLCEYHAR